MEQKYARLRFDNALKKNGETSEAVFTAPTWRELRQKVLAARAAFAGVVFDVQAEVRKEQKQAGAG